MHSLSSRVHGRNQWHLLEVEHLAKASQKLCHVFAFFSSFFPLPDEGLFGEQQKDWLSIAQSGYRSAKF